MSDEFKIDELKDYYIFTDGSGFVSEPCGGCCAIVLNAVTMQQDVVSSSNSNTTVYREEFSGILQGLSLLNKIDKRQGLTVAWYSDCQSLVNSVLTPAQRKSHRDYWEMFEYFESIYTIEPNYVPRDAGIKWMDEADLQASTVSRLMLEYQIQIKDE